MSDFVTELRREVVGAHAAHRQSAARTRRRRWRPILAGALALAACVAAIVVAYRALPAPEQTAEPHVVKLLHIGGVPNDAVLAAGSLWVGILRRPPGHPHRPRAREGDRADPARQGAQQHRRRRRERVGTRLGRGSHPHLAHRSGDQPRRRPVRRPVRRRAGCEPGSSVPRQDQSGSSLLPAVLGHRAAHT